MNTLHIHFTDKTSKVINLHPAFFTKKKEEDVELDARILAETEIGRKPLRIELTKPNGVVYKNVWLENVPEAEKPKVLEISSKQNKVLSLKPKLQKA